MNDFKVTYKNGFYYIEYTAGATFFKENGEWFAITNPNYGTPKKVQLEKDCLNAKILNKAERKEKLRKLLT